MFAARLGEGYAFSLCCQEFGALMYSRHGGASIAGERYEAFDVLALVAGIQGLKPIVEMDDSDWNDHIDVNLTGTANCLRAFAPPMLKRGKGRIILTSSTQGRHRCRVLGLDLSDAQQVGSQIQVEYLYNLLFRAPTRSIAVV